MLGWTLKLLPLGGVITLLLTVGCAAQRDAIQWRHDEKVLEFFGRSNANLIARAERLEVRMAESRRFQQANEIRTASNKSLERMKKLLLEAKSYRWPGVGEIEFCLDDFSPDFFLILTHSTRALEIGVSVRCSELIVKRLPTDGGPAPAALWSGGVARANLANSGREFVGIAMFLFPKARRFTGFRAELTAGWDE